MKRFKFASGAALAIALGAILVLSGCAFTGKYKQLYMLADWVEINHQSLQARYEAATDEEKAYLYQNVNPFMNIAKHAVVGLGAMDREDDVKLAAEITAIEKEVTAGKLDYDPYNLIWALRTKDYNALELEILALKRLIVAQLT
jgi:hypothetical protein